MSQNTFSYNPCSLAMYVDMNSFFASCEQQDNEALRGKPIGVITHPSPNACVIAPSNEAKPRGVKTGMRLNECKLLCPELIPVVARPYRYRHYHMLIMEVLNSYCNDVIARSIDEAVMNLTSYQYIYPDPMELGHRIKADIAKACGEFVKCSIGIAPNAFLAKVATDLKKPDGLTRITPENIDGYLKQMKLTDLPGIATANEKRLLTVGIRTPYDIRHGSEALLRKAFGGIVGNYWYRRLNFIETDIYQNDYRGMSAGRTVSRQQRESPQALESLFISLCTRLEQRLVKQNVFCKEINLHIRYYDMPSWKTKVRLNHPIQDALEMRQYLKQRIDEFEQTRGFVLFNNKVQNIGVSIADFIKANRVEYGLFENKLQQDTARKVLYEIKDQYGKNIVRKASEIISPHEMRDAIGFGSVKDLYINENGITEENKKQTNKYLLEDDSTEATKGKLTPLQAKERAKQNPKLPQHTSERKEDTNYYEMSDNEWEGIDMFNEYTEEFAA